jgi:hypothetical protein
LAILAVVVKASGLLQLGRPGQSRKTLSTSMLDRKALGSEMAWREEQKSKTPVPIVVTESGSVMDVREEQP